MIDDLRLIKEVKLLAALVMKNQLKVAVAESCTGGMIAAYLTEISGSSAWFERGFVTYSNQAKQDMLAVDEGLIREYGAVSEQVARAMAEGALKRSFADITLSVTGIAGPEGGTQEKPVGTVHFAWAMDKQPTEHARQLFLGDRHEIRLQSCYFGLEQIIKKLSLHFA